LNKCRVWRLKERIDPYQLSERCQCVQQDCNLTCRNCLSYSEVFAVESRRS
jgi:hypothetical protein